MRLTLSSNRPATIAFWLAVFATLFSLVVPQFGAVIIGMPVGLGAAVFGIVGILRAREKGGRSLAISGLVLGLVGPIVALAIWVFIVEVFDIPT